MGRYEKSHGDKDKCNTALYDTTFDIAQSVSSQLAENLALTL
jgi:hypothetical protein